MGGLCQKPKTFDIDEILKLAPLEERVYALRCVEAWSMVIPWIGYPLSALLKRVEPTGSAKYVEFQTLVDPEQMPGHEAGLLRSSLDWPYVEGLRLDEAMHPLALLTVGIYGHVLPNQNGAPVRVVVPWKYGFKSTKSHRADPAGRPTSRRPAGTRRRRTSTGSTRTSTRTVDHPRWSQATERRIGEFRRRKTLMFNGYDQVASLYTGMDLKKQY